MSCPNQDELIWLVLAGDDGQATGHLAACAICRAALEDWRRLAARLADTHQSFDEGHVMGRQRLMAAVAREPVSTFRSPIRKGRLSMKQRVAFSGMAVAAALLLAVWLVVAGRPLSAMEQVAAKIREAKSFSLEVSQESDGEQLPDGKLYWQAPGTVRMESTATPEVTVFPYHQPGIEIDEKHKTYKRLPAREGYTSPIMAIWKLGDFSGDADKELAPRNVDDRPSRGFQIAAEKLDPSCLQGTLNIWVDADTNLPALVEFETGRPKEKMTLHHIRWNTPLDAKLFDTTPPEGYADDTPKPPSVEKVVEYMRQALKFYAETMGGHYPRVKMVYGDVTMHELGNKLGLDAGDARRLTEEQIKSEAYVKSLQAIHGFAWINTILRDNSDAAYYGKTVGPNDKDKVLLRWKLDDGGYHVIYGDLHGESVGADRLKDLESR